MGADTPKESLEIRDTAISVGIAAIVQILSILAVGNASRDGFMPAHFGFLLIGLPITFLVAFYFYAKGRRYSLRPVIAHAVLSGLFSFCHFLYWANRIASIG